MEELSLSEDWSHKKCGLLEEAAPAASEAKTPAQDDDATDDGRPDELLADGTVHYDPAADCWVGVVDWQGLRHASDEPDAARNAS